VITRAYNSERYIKEAVESTLNQNYGGWIEIVLCYDEGSTDNTLNILETYVPSKFVNRQIRLVKHPHTSRFRALVEYGFANVTGDYVAFLDYDNLFPEDYFKKIVKHAVDNDCEFLFTKRRVIDENGMDRGMYESNVPKDLHSLRSMMLTNYVDTNIIFIRRDLLALLAAKLKSLTNDFYEDIIEDWLIGMLAVKHSNVEYFEGAEVKFRIHKSNTVVSVYRETSVGINLVSLESDYRTLSAFKYLEKGKLSASERFYFYIALIERLTLIFMLKWMIGKRCFPIIHKAHVTDRLKELIFS